MEVLIEILKLVLPAAAVLLASFFLVNRFLESDQKKREYELKKTSQSIITPLKLQAYERIVIFLERIDPNSLVVRVNKHGMNAHQLHQELIRAIKSEYEHNLSQQIYISHSAWELVKNAKEEIIKAINISSTKVAHDSSSNELAMIILNLVANLDKKMPNQIALDYTKKEIAQLF